MTRARVERFRGRSGASLTAVCRIALAGCALVCGACITQPFPKVVVAGTTFAFPVGTASQLIGFQSLATRNQLVYDHQRGEMLFFLYPTGGQGSTDPHHPNNVRLTTRFIQRILPDPASQTGIQNEAGGDTFMFPILEIEQVLAFLDVPLLRNDNTTPSAGTYNLAHRVVRGTSPFAPGAQVLVPTQPYNPGITLQVVAATSAKYTPFTGYHGPLLGGPVNAEPWLAAEHFPHPKLLLSWNHMGAARSGHVELTFPTANPNAVTIKDVHEQGHLGRHSIVLWRPHLTESNKVIIDWVSRESAVPPSQPVTRLAVVFQLSGTTQIQPSLFTIAGSASKLFDNNGAELASPTYSSSGGIF